MPALHRQEASPDAATSLLQFALLTPSGSSMQVARVAHSPYSHPPQLPPPGNASTTLLKHQNQNCHKTATP